MSPYYSRYNATRTYSAGEYAPAGYVKAVFGLVMFLRVSYFFTLVYVRLLNHAGKVCSGDYRSNTAL